MSRPGASIAVAAAAAVALLAAGCGGGGSPSPRVASVGSSTASAMPAVQDPAAAFARCMRSNGVPRWPDVGKATPQELGVSQAQFAAGVNACRHLLPNGGGSPQNAQQSRTELADELSFARCMRSHGLRNFPDPTARDGLTVEMVQAQGIDVRSPRVLRIVQACLPASHGALTPAKVREAIANAGR